MMIGRKWRRPAPPEAARESRLSRRQPPAHLAESGPRCSPARFRTKKKAHAFQHELFFIACIFQNTSFRTMVCSLEGPTLTMPIGTPMSFAICSR